jgi:hypothetical protein
MAATTLPGIVKAILAMNGIIKLMDVSAQGLTTD